MKALLPCMGRRSNNACPATKLYLEGLVAMPTTKVRHIFGAKLRGLMILGAFFVQSAAAADSVVVLAKPEVDQLVSGIPIFSPGAKLCTKAVTVCARQLQPLGVEIGGTFTVKIEDHYKSTYECSIVDGKPTWLATSVEGSCEPQPIILLPAKYDADEAWNVG